VPESSETPAARPLKPDRKEARVSSIAPRDAERTPRKAAAVPRGSLVFVVVLLLVAGYLGLLAAAWLGYLDLSSLLQRMLSP
jgi:hypothetical protein